MQHWRQSAAKSPVHHLLENYKTLNQRMTKKTIKNINKNLDNDKNTTEAITDDQKNPIGFYCDVDFSSSKAGEQWVQCHSCQGWVHESCRPVEDGADYFKCDLCL